MKCALVLCVLSFICFQKCHFANIVVFMPLPFYSHQTTFKPLWLELAKRGHNITLIQTNVIIENNENITHISLSGIFDLMDKQNPLEKLEEGHSVISVLISSVDVAFEVINYELTHPGVQALLKGETKVDLFFTEYYPTFGFFLGRRLNASIIGLVSMDANIDGHTVAGNPTHPLIYPDKDMPFSQPLTLKERTMNTLFWITFKIATMLIITPTQQKAVKANLGDETPIGDVVQDMSLLFINANPLFSVIRPLGPKTINIGGGLHILQPQPLPTDLQHYLDNAKNGVIYFSLGSSITSKQMSNVSKEIILKTFSQLPYKILWKFDTEIVKKPDNVKVMKWMPQQDILRHKNIKLFITQGGLQSMEEAILNYVPMIALPFYGDQHNNADKMVAKGFGLKLDHKTLDEKSFKSTILEVLTNPKYRERTKELADLVLDQPMSGLEKAVWWTEYILRHGQTKHFDNPLSDIPWYQFLLLDVILFLVVTTTVVIYAISKTLQLLKWLMYKTLKKKTRTKID